MLKYTLVQNGALHVRVGTDWVRIALSLVAVGCSGTSITNVGPASGGASTASGGASTGGASATTGGGIGPTAGSPASGGNGGATGSGGVAPIGGATANGGSGGSSASLVVTGGAGNTGGLTGSTTPALTGGAATTLVATGGAGATGGFVAQTTATGGAVPTGGTGSGTSTGTVAIGGSSAETGGTSANGTTNPTTGGTASSGGASVTGGTSAAAGGTTAASTGLLANCSLLLHMDEAAWSGTAGEVRDASGSDNHGTPMLGATTSATAKFGNAGLFGGEGYVTVDSANDLHVLGAFSVAAWIYPTFLDGSRAPGIIAKRWSWTTDVEFALFLWEQNRLHVDIMSDDNRFASNATFDMGRWYHVAVVFDGSLPVNERVRVYVDGQLDKVAAESSAVVASFDSPVEVGRLRDGGQGFMGSIDEVGLWQRALSEAEVQTVYQLGAL